MIGIIDYGAGNLNSVKKAFDSLKCENRLIREPRDFETIEKLVLPGVGAFGHAIKRIKKTGFYEIVKKRIEADKPFLGICLGLQMLFESSEESPGEAGFAFIKGQSRKFGKLKVPQIGWNQIDIKKEVPLLDGIQSGENFYFVHSYYALTEHKDDLIASTTYGLEYASIVGKGRSYAVQFHPEKSGTAGIKLLKNWVEKC